MTNKLFIFETLGESADAVYCKLKKSDNKRYKGTIGLTSGFIELPFPDHITSGVNLYEMSEDERVNQLAGSDIYLDGYMLEEEEAFYQYQDDLYEMKEKLNEYIKKIIHQNKHSIGPFGNAGFIPLYTHENGDTVWLVFGARP